jgi:uncharacterized membrane protein YsdA (DUF1294 family)
VLALWAWSWLAAASAVGLAAAVADKRRARRGRGRVPEAAFHALALAGGWPGELLGFAVARHKTRKVRFLVPFVLAALANVALLAWAWGRLAA